MGGGVPAWQFSSGSADLAANLRMQPPQGGSTQEFHIRATETHSHYHHWKGHPAPRLASIKGRWRQRVSAKAQERLVSSCRSDSHPDCYTQLNLLESPQPGPLWKPRPFKKLPCADRNHKMKLWLLDDVG